MVDETMIYCQLFTIKLLAILVRCFACVPRVVMMSAARVMAETLSAVQACRDDNPSCCCVVPPEVRSPDSYIQLLIVHLLYS